LGIEALIADDPARAMNIAQQLDALNRERRSIEAEMREDAAMLLADLEPGERASLTLFDPTWHQGVVGILAGRTKDKHHRPTFAFARGENGEAKGSGRSIAGLHLRDALDLVAKRHPTLLKRFGGHAAAAGVTLDAADIPVFEAAFETVARELLTPAQLTRRLETDGPLEGGYFGVPTVRVLQQAVWGQAFPAPLFDDVFQVENQRLLKDKHLKLSLRKGGLRVDAIRFDWAEPAPPKVRVAFRPDINEWNGTQSVQLLLEHIEAA
ncbi:single-stranded-DNA-specific exonuclease RecJ, partial [bacterium]|nr:single-stranded-DNA-specific exonuclease RecJ [bacterium]